MAHIDLYTLDDLGTTYALNVKRMENIHEQTQGEVDTPHRHDYYTVIWVKDGTGQHTIDFNTYELAPGAVFFVSPGQVHQVSPKGMPQGWVITFSKSFLQHNHISEDFIAQINLFNNFNERPPIFLSEETAAELSTLMEQMETVFESQMTYRIAALSAYLKLFLIYVESQCMERPSDLEDQHGGKQILKQFKQLVEANIHLWHKVGDYAEQMHITSRYLNQVVKSLLGQTAKEVIQEKISLKAKRDLKYSDKSVKEIAYDLGFDDPLYFSSFFKKNTGVSPSAFRGK